MPVLSLVPKKAQAFIKPDDLVFYVTCTYDPRQMRPGTPACKGGARRASTPPGHVGKPATKCPTF